jgi:hypothetical protein
MVPPSREDECDGDREATVCSASRADQEADMFVTVLHHITDPAGFEAAEAKALEAGLPPSVALPIHAATADHRTGVCIWEGESVDAVRELVESVVGPFSDNEYFEMSVDGLEPALT